MSKVPPARRRPARTLAALSGSPRYIQYRGDPPPCDRTHRTPPGLPFGQTTLLSTHALAPESGRTCPETGKAAGRPEGRATRTRNARHTCPAP
ncbi:hypothetical protein DBP18_01200 [Streptomyces sp. CS081A]|nr:hypothetical protein DBP18_01200 [Streptomyces sp. CS081A]